MDARYVELSFSSINKKNNMVCGDLVAVERNDSGTTLIVSDGMGSGIKANIAAQLTVSRFRELLRQGFSLRDSFRIVVQGLHDVRGTELPYAVFSVACILNSGVTTVLSYEMPSPLLMYRNYISVLSMHEFTLGSEVIAESELTLNPDDGLILFTDGVSQAGLGFSNHLGWMSSGVADFLRTRSISSNSQTVKDIIDKARQLDGMIAHDDTTVAFAKYRKGLVLSIFTGPPAQKEQDVKFVSEFLDQPGIKVVCGSTSANIVARVLGRDCEMSKIYNSPIEPPAYQIEGIHLVTEGAVTLNQVYNILECDLSEHDSKSPVHQLCLFLQICDRVDIWQGSAKNSANTGLRFQQLGVSPRAEIIPKIVQKLKAMSKLVVVHQS